MSVIEAQKIHNISLNNRSKCVVTGVKDIVMSDEEQIELHTFFDKLLIKGRNLSIGNLDVAQGKLEFTGTVDTICYLKQRNKKSFTGLLGKNKY